MDFDSFWKKKMKFINDYEVSYTLVKQDFSTFENIEYYSLFFKSADGAEIHAKYIKNNKVRHDNPSKKIGALFYFHGYPASSRNWLEKSSFCALGYDVFALDFRSQGGLSKDTSSANPSALGHLVAGLNDDLDNMIFIKNIIDSLILIKLVQTFPDIDSSNLITYGASQGGAFSIICSALYDIKKCISLYPFLSNFKELYSNDNSKNAYNELNLYSRWFDAEGKKEKLILEKLSYIDVLNFAPKIHSDVLFGISELDKDCPVKTQYDVYNSIKSKKKLCIYKKFKHEDISHFNNEILYFLLNTNLGGYNEFSKK